LEIGGVVKNILIAWFRIGITKVHSKCNWWNREVSFIN
jgi:hypothetical protein